MASAERAHFWQHPALPGVDLLDAPVRPPRLRPPHAPDLRDRGHHLRGRGVPRPRAGGTPLAAAAGAFFLGVRNAFYGLRLSQLLQLPRAVKPLDARAAGLAAAAVALLPRAPFLARRRRRGRHRTGPSGGLR